MDADILENKYKGYKISDLSESLRSVLHDENSNNIVQSFTGSYLHYLESIDWIQWIPSLHTALVMMYFLLLVSILGGISSFMWKKFDIKGKSQSDQTSLEHQLLGTGKYAKYVNAAVAFKIYQEEMEKDDTSEEDSDDSDDSDGNNDDDPINASTLIGGYHKTKKLRARTIRKQQIREQRENYERYKKRLQYEKKLKRYKKKKEKKAARKVAKKIKAQKKNEKHNKDKSGWFDSMHHSFANWFDDNQHNNNNMHETKENKKNNKAKVIKNTKDSKVVKSTKCKDDKIRNHRKSLEDMIINDCSNEIVIDLQEYYLNKIKSSDVYCKITKDMKSLMKMIKSLALKHKECEGIIDSNTMIYFRWNKECEQKLVRWIQETGKCDVQNTGEKMLAISKQMFKRETPT